MQNKPSKNQRTSLLDRQKRIYGFLHRNHVGVLATVDPNHEPHGSVIYYVIDEQFTVSFLTKTSTKKYDNLINNDHSVLVVFESTSQTVAQVIGKATEIRDVDDINDIAAAVFENSLKGRKPGIPPVAKLPDGEFVAFRIVPDQIKLATYSHPDGGNTQEIFESIESFTLKD